MFSAYIKEVEEKPGPTPGGSKMPFGAVLAGLGGAGGAGGGGGGVHSGSFSSPGNGLAWVSHDSTLPMGASTQGALWGGLGVLQVWGV